MKILQIAEDLLIADFSEPRFLHILQTQSEKPLFQDVSSGISPWSSGKTTDKILSLVSFTFDAQTDIMMIQAPKDPKSQPPEKRASLVSELSYQTLRENVVSAIRTKILNQELAPGTRIVEQSLSREFGISRGPIREALRQLEQEGLVEYTRNAGCSVKAITLEDIYEIYLLRSH